MGDRLLGRPQVFVFTLPVIDPRALAPFALVDWPLQAAHVANATLGVSALEGHKPDTAHARVHFAASVDANSPTGTVAQLLWTRHRTGIRGYGQGALAAHSAGKQPTLHEPFDKREGAVKGRCLLQQHRS